VASPSIEEVCHIPLSHLLSTLRTDDSLILRAFGEGEYAASSRKTSGAAGLVGTLLIFFAVLSTFWAALDPTMDMRSIFAYSAVLFGGLALSLGFGFQFARKPDMRGEITAVSLGIGAGIVMLAMQSGIFFISGLLPYSTQGTWLIILAPVAETLMFTVAFFHLFKTHFPELGWLQIAVASDVTFAMFHFFAYGYRADFWLILIILLLGNTVLMYIYHLTKNFTAPAVAHLIVNLAVVQDEVVAGLLANIGTFIILFTVFVLVYLCLGRFGSENH